MKINQQLTTVVNKLQNTLAKRIY